MTVRHSRRPHAPLRGQVTFGSPSQGSGQHFGLEQMKLMTGTSFVQVPYKVAAPRVDARAVT